jgi:hypothetical protein
MRYSSGSTKVGCESLRTTWGSLGCAAPATKAAVHSDSRIEDFIVNRCCSVVLWLEEAWCWSPGRRDDAEISRSCPERDWRVSSWKPRSHASGTASCLSSHHLNMDIREQNLQSAIADIDAGVYSSQQQASKAWKVPRSMLANRIAGRRARKADLVLCNSALVASLNRFPNLSTVQPTTVQANKLSFRYQMLHHVRQARKLVRDAEFVWGLALKAASEVAAREARIEASLTRMEELTDSWDLTDSSEPTKGRKPTRARKRICARGVEIGSPIIDPAIFESAMCPTEQQAKPRTRRSKRIQTSNKR